MSGLQKATLQEIKSDRNGTPVGNAVKVQFNPASVKLTLHNANEGGKSRGRQARQFAVVGQVLWVVVVTEHDVRA